ncbi:MAG: hypothetical protein ABW196_06915 [Solirubrobacterales bacterium]
MIDSHASPAAEKARAHAVLTASALLALAVAVLLILAPGAQADIGFCPFGEAAGQCGDARDAASDRATGRLYVADEENRRVNVFEADGTFAMAFGWGVKDGSAELQKCTTATGCLKGLSGSGAGQFGGELKIAVDNDLASPSQHDVYIAQASQDRVQKFDSDGNFLLAFGSDGGGLGQFEQIRGIGVSSGGLVYLADQKSEGTCPSGFPKSQKRVQVFGELGSPIEAILPGGIPCGSLTAIAADSTGRFYLLVEGEGIRKYDTSANLLCEVDKGVETTALAVDDEDHLFSAQREDKVKVNASYRLISRYDDSCNPVSRFAYGVLQQSVRGLATTGSGEVFAAQATFGESGNRALLFTPPPPGPFVVPVSVEADSGTLSNTKVTLAAEVNPNGKATQVRFEYLDEESFEEQGGFTGPATKSLEVALAGDLKLHGAEALAGCPDPVTEASLPESKCLIPETKYRFRVMATNADGEGNGPIEGEFTTKPALELGEAWSTDVGTDAAVLHAEVTPLGVPATGYFEYVDDATWQASGFAEALQAPAVSKGEAPLDFGAGEDPVARGASLYPLLPGTTYHYRLVAEDPLIEPLPGPEGSFRTFVAKGPVPCAANEDFRTGPSALLPDCRAYEMVTPLDKANGDILVLGETLSGLPATLNQSSVSGGRLAYGSYRAFGDAKSAPWTSQYIAARGEEGWSTHGISPPVERHVFDSVFEYDDAEFRAFSPDLCDGWLVTVTDPTLAPGAIEGFLNVYRRTDEECGGEDFEALSTREWENLEASDPHIAKTELQGVSADGAEAIFIARDSLVGSGAPDLGGGSDQLYLWSAATGPVFACVLPSGEALGGSCSGGTNTTVGAGNHRRGNMRNAISADGTRVFWSAPAGGPGKIYLREHPEQGQVGGECSEAGVACTVAVSKEAEELSATTKSTFQAAAADGSRAIFTTEGGEPDFKVDLYEFALQGEVTELIAHEIKGLLGTSEDASHVYFSSGEALGGANSEGASAVAGKTNLYHRHAGTVDFIGTLAGAEGSLARRGRVSPDGLHAAFMSKAPLTGYDNTDANNGEADAEVFLYDAAQKELTCVSCNPSGARPEGANIEGDLAPLWAAAQLPVFQNTLYTSHAMADDGSRLFFESSDALVPRDTNGVQDVYEWEEAGTGDCEEADATFSAEAQGCIDLISSGQSAKASEFVDADPDGSDVFFTTLASLLPQDYGLVDIYDARIEGGYPAPPPPEVDCEGEACQSPQGAPDDPTPASASFRGQGNVAETTGPRPRCAKGKTRRKGRCVPRKHHKRAKRASHKGRAGR